MTDKARFTIVTYQNGTARTSYEAETGSDAFAIHDELVAHIHDEPVNYPGVYDIVVRFNTLGGLWEQLQRTEVEVWTSETADDIDDGVWGQRNTDERDLTALDIRSAAFQGRTTLRDNS